MLTHTQFTQGRDLVDLGSNIRPEDAEEIFVSTGLDVLPGLVTSVASSDVAITVMAGDETVCVFGAGSVGGGYGIIWMLASEHIKKHGIHFLRHVNEYVDALHDITKCKYLYNYTYAKNHLHHRLLKMAHFQFYDKVYLRHGYEFYPVIREKI